MLFGNRIYPEETLRAHEIEISEMLKTQHLCPNCTQLDTCQMLPPGWQTVYDIPGSESYGRPVFRVRKCPRCYELQHRRQEPRMYTPKAIVQTFDTFSVTNDTADMFQKCYDYARDFSSQFTTRGLLIAGPRGTGKSHMAMAIAKKILGYGSIPVGFVNVPDLLAEIKAGWDDPKLAMHAKVSLEKRFLVLDDLGAEQTTPWVVAEFYKIIDHRDQHGLPTVVTTNFLFEQLEKMFPRPFDRILGMCDVAINNAPSYRRMRPAPPQQQQAKNKAKKAGKKEG